MKSIAHPKLGMQTSNNDKYLRLWFEVDYTEFEGSSLKLKWIKYLKGGAYRKWYGNLDYLLHYNKNPEYILQQKNARVLDLDFLKKKKCTWTDLTSGMNSFRFAPNDTFYDISGHCFFPDEDDQYWLLAYANSKIFAELKKRGFATFGRENFIEICPPLIITKEELEEYLPILDEVLTMVDEKFCD